MGPVRRPVRADFPSHSPHRDPLLRGGGSPFGALSGVLFRRLRRSPCSIFWSITTRIFTAPDRGKPLAFGICHAGVLELALASRNRTALYSLLTLARWFPLIHR